MTSEEKELLIYRLSKKSRLRKLSDEDIYNLIDLYYVDTPSAQEVKSFTGEPFHMGIRFYESVYPEFYNQIVEASEMGRVIIGESLQKSTTKRLTRRVYVKLRGTNRDAFSLVHEFAHYIDIVNEGKYIPKTKENLYVEAFALYMERQFEKYLLENEFFLSVSDNRLRKKSSFSSYASALSDYMWLKNIYDATGSIPNYEQDRLNNVLSVDSIDPKLYLTRYLIGDIISDTLEDVEVDNLKDGINKLSLHNEIEKRLKK